MPEFKKMKMISKNYIDRDRALKLESANRAWHTSTNTKSCTFDSAELGADMPNRRTRGVLLHCDDRKSKRVSLQAPRTVRGPFGLCAKSGQYVADSPSYSHEAVSLIYNGPVMPLES